MENLKNQKLNRCHQVRVNNSLRFNRQAFKMTLSQKCTTLRLKTRVVWLASSIDS